MKLLYICHERLPSPHTNTEQIVKSVVALVEQNVQVRLVCPGRKEEKNTGRDRMGEIASFYGISPETFRQGLELIELPVPFFITGKSVRLFHDLNAARYARKEDYDFVYTRDLFSLLAALAWGEMAIFETYRIDINTLARFWWWRAFCYPRRNLKGIVTHSQMARSLFIRAGIHPDRVVVAYNGGLTDAGGLTTSRAGARRQIGLAEEKKIILYTGHIHQKKGLEILLPIAVMLPDVQFVLVGGIPDSSPTKRLQRQIGDRRITNISIVPRVPPSKVALFLSAADCLILPPSALPLQGRRTVLPMKTFQYLGAGRPILGPDTPDVGEVLKHLHNAILVPPDSPQAAASALQDLLDDQALQKQLSRNAKSDAENFTWQKRAEKIIVFLTRLLTS